MVHSIGSSPHPSLSEHDLLRLAQAWQQVDPCLTYRDAVAAAIKAGPDALQALFGQPLQFGTAGLRGQLGPGPGAMNRVMVRLVAHALGQTVLERGGNQVAIAFDARHQSDEFAIDTARVLAKLGVTARLFDEPVPTPVLAFAVRHLGADAGVMVTASHNPRTDNGYKIYGPDGAIISSPADDEITELMRTLPLVDEDGLVDENHANIVPISDELVDSYVNQVAELLTPGSSRTAKVAYTPLHGVGHQVLARTFERAGFAAPTVVTDQQDPDGDFPHLAYPNPEEPGALGRLFAVASDAGADVALANDPDADRLAVAVPSHDSWHLLSGDELGCLLAHYLLGRGDPSTRNRLVLNTIVSSRLLGQIAADHQAQHHQTLTGFKWIMHARSRAPDAQFVLGYEEALGYAIGDVVRDKDGISAALVVAEMVGELASQGKTLLDARDELHLQHGVHLSGQRSLRFEVNGPTAAEIMSWLRASPPAVIGDSTIVQIVDLFVGEYLLPATDALVFVLDGARITVRPSGTEPKLKVYGECWLPRPDHAADVAGDRRRAHTRLASLLHAICSHICDPERNMTSARLDGATSADDELAARAATLFTGEPTSMGRAQALRLVVDCIDLTTLAGDDTDGRVRALCAQARRPDPSDPTVGPTAAVCVYPNLVSLAVELTRGSGVAVASVAGAFPSGLSSLEVKLSDIAEAVCSGADEIDVVLNRAAFLAGRDDVVLDELRAMRQQVGSRVMKVILETGELETAAAIRHAARVAMQARADWIKTSTGKSGTGATPHAVLAMATAIDDHVARGGSPVGLKISGGVRTSEQALGYLAIIEATLGPAWLDANRVRFGASGLLGAVVADLTP